MNSLIATLPSLYAATIAFAVCAGAVCLWRKGNKAYAALVVGGSVALGLLVFPSWTVAILIVGGFIYGASFVKTTGASIATMVVLFGLLSLFGMWLIS